MPTSAEILASLQPLFRDILDIPDLVLTPGMSAKNIEEWDSLNHIRIISATEQKFSVQISSAELEKFTCVGDFVDLLIVKLTQ